MPRIFALSDQHGHLDFELPRDADLILHAGDVCPDYFPGSSHGSSLQEKWLANRWMPWAAGSNIKATFGNHDFVRKQEAPKCFRVDELYEHDGLKVWFSPWSNLFGGWAWMKPPTELVEMYASIPLGTDIIVSHGPAYGYGDLVDERYWFGDADPHVGSKELLAAIDRVRPAAVVCGHIHSGYGTYTHDDTTIYNVSLVDEAYKRVNPLTEILL